MILKNKMSKLGYSYRIPQEVEEYIKIKLIILDKHKINLSEMFYQCNSLIAFYKDSLKESDILNEIKEDKKIRPNETKNKIDEHIYNNLDKISNYYSNDKMSKNITINNNIIKYCMKPSLRKKKIRNYY